MLTKLMAAVRKFYGIEVPQLKPHNPMDDYGPPYRAEYLREPVRVYKTQERKSSNDSWLWWLLFVD